MKEYKLSPPWVIYYNKIKALFENDKDVNIMFDEVEPAITLHVYGTEKAKAIERLIPAETNFGGNTLKVTVIPEEIDLNSPAEIFRAAFKGNSVLHGVEAKETPFGDFTYAIFDSEAVYLNDDDLGSPYGYTAKLIEDIVREIMDIPAGAFVCSDVRSYKF